jgi:hypothetical protein
MVGLIRLILFFFTFLSYSQEHILIGDSQTFYMSKYSTKIIHIKKLSKEGIGVNELNKKIISYPTSHKIKSVSVCIGVNDFYKDKGIEPLMNTIKRTFPNAKIFVIQGSWGWGNVKKDNSSTILKYYKIFHTFGTEIVEPPIGSGDPHRDKKIYKTIIQIIETKIKMIENTKGDSTRFKAKGWPLKYKVKKNYVVGILSMYENDLKLFKVEAENKYEALKKGMVEYTPEENRHYEIEFQNGEVCPPNFESLTDYYAVGEIITNVMEI